MYKVDIAILALPRAEREKAAVSGRSMENIIDAFCLRTAFILSSLPFLTDIQSSDQKADDLEAGFLKTPIHFIQIQEKKTFFMSYYIHIIPIL